MTMFRELLIEIGCEEIPAGWLPSLTDQFGDRLTHFLDEARLEWTAPAHVFSTPRRLGVYVGGVSNRQSDLEENLTGPPVRAAFDTKGQPTAAALGFARKQGVCVDDLRRVQTPKGEYVAHQRLQRGAVSRTVLPGVLASALRALSFPKQMHWDAWLDDGHGELVFGRPIRWILFLYGATVVPFKVLRSDRSHGAGVAAVSSGSVTYGHRFFSKSGRPGRPMRVRSFSDYKRVLAANYVIIDREKRRARITQKLERCADRVGGRVGGGADQSFLLEEVPDLVEYPSVVTGTYPPEFLRLPDEVLKTTMIHHQHYFPVVNLRGRLKPHFLAVTNTPRDNVSRIARNAERVLVARLRDARFFWDADRKGRLEDRLDRLSTLVFHRKLGSYRAKADRISTLAEQIARDVLGADSITAAAASQAGLLCKADLATDMVGEFPELQGTMGGVYAREQGESEEVWKAIYYHYLPVGVESDAPPTRHGLGVAAVTWAAVALADKLDTLVGLFQVGEKPTGSRDPFGMRRQAQGLIRVLVDLPELLGLEVRVPLGQLLEMAHTVHGRPDVHTADRETAFVRERTRYLLEERGFDIRNVRSVTEQVSLDDLRPLDARRKLEVLPEFTDTPDFRRLAVLFKRIKNIARELPDEEFAVAERDGGVELSETLTEPAEEALLVEVNRGRVVIDRAVARGEGYREAFAQASAFGPAVDRFFTDVFVMVDDSLVRQARLRLMKRLERLISQLADISDIVPEEESLSQGEQVSHTGRKGFNGKKTETR
jgi:glycyl-tRNA synthetase beta chain